VAAPAAADDADAAWGDTAGFAPAPAPAPAGGDGFGFDDAAWGVPVPAAGGAPAHAPPASDADWNF
jgi:hypothetical protein